MVANSRVAQAIVDLMREKGIPLTVENYVGIVCGTDYSGPLPEGMPEELEPTPGRPTPEQLKARGFVEVEPSDRAYTMPMRKGS